MALIGELRQALEQSKLTFEELRAFEAGLVYLTKEEQEEFLTAIKDNPDLIYPLYINYKAKLHAATNGNQEDWEKVVEQEITELEEMIERRRVGDETF
jgi:hypothetical protein